MKPAYSSIRESLGQGVGDYRQWTETEREKE